jgi:hypothetical protein
MNDRTFERIESLFDIALFADVKVLVAGCGSGGASVAPQVVMSGIRNFTLIDNDTLGPENVIRHVCGRRFIGQKKVDAVAGLREIRTRPLFVMRLDVRPLQIVGGTPGVYRRIGVVPGGTFDGERLSGEVLEGGNDWQAVRKDGSTTLDVRLVLKTTNGALIGMTYFGVRHGSPGVIASG